MFIPFSRLKKEKQNRRKEKRNKFSTYLRHRLNVPTKLREHTRSKRMLRRFFFRYWYYYWFYHKYRIQKISVFNFLISTFACCVTASVSKCLRTYRDQHFTYIEYARNVQCITYKIKFTNTKTHLQSHFTHAHAHMAK